MRKVKKGWRAGAVDSVEGEVVYVVSCRFLVMAMPWVRKRSA